MWYFHINRRESIVTNFVAVPRQHNLKLNLEQSELIFIVFDSNNSQKLHTYCCLFGVRNSHYVIDN